MDDVIRKPVKHDILCEEFIHVPDSKEIVELVGNVTSDHGVLRFFDDSKKEAISIFTSKPEAASLMRYAGKVCKTKVETRKNWFKFWGKPYTRLIVQVIENGTLNTDSRQKTEALIKPERSDSKTEEEVNPVVEIDYTPQAPSVHLPKEAEIQATVVEPELPKTSDADKQLTSSNYSTYKTSTSPRKAICEEEISLIRRGPKDYYQKLYRFLIPLEIAANDNTATRYKQVDPSTVQPLLYRDSDHQLAVKLMVDDDEIGRLSQRFDSEAISLFIVGYTVEFSTVTIRENEQLTDRGFGGGSAKEPQEAKYTVRMPMALRKPEKLDGEEVVPSKLYPSKNSAAIHTAAVNACADKLLSPDEALALEFVALGATKPSISKTMGWSIGYTTQLVMDVYKKRGVKSKAELVKGIEGIASSGREAKASTASNANQKQAVAVANRGNTIFSFEIAGTSYRKKAAEGLLRADTYDVFVSREPKNKHDPNAIAVYAFGKHVGYVPRIDAASLARLMDSGYTVEVTEVSASTRFYSNYEDDYPTAYITLRCTNPAATAQSKSNNQTKKAATQNKTSTSRKARSSKGNKRYVGVADFIVRSHGHSCNHKGHTMTNTEASVTVLVAGKTLEERKFRAFYCEKCGMYFVTDTTYESLTRRARLCCRVVEMEYITNPKKGNGRYSNFAEESLIHQYGYNVSKAEGLSSKERQTILSFVIENGIMTPYGIISHIEGLISTREGMRNMLDAVAKWKEDVRFLEHYEPPKRSLKVGKMYVKKGKSK